ncbi:hypothetical protein [Mucilaginibacter celer]|uniref:Uncharacterized protein n=1 Tax=Mucilaginibacter celer TaxID=2305508 RepID=A0A494VXE6_9SPHI|nr:hypothetical protein [Mucilaginibacter celer]AYL95998.1 hypothetical protein HYN43_012185 [Mucilaginibacter celer]
MIFLNLFKKDPLRQKILAIKKDIKKIISKVCTERYWIEWVGAYHINPKHLAFRICVKSDDMKLKLKSDAELYKVLRDVLDKHDYPVEARDKVFIGFESQQTVDRESDGKWHIHVQ